MRRPIAAVALVIGCGASATALAQPIEEGSPDTQLAPRDALEIGVHAGYTQPIGDIAADRRMADLIEAGGAVALEIAYRLSPRWGIGVSGQFHESHVDDTFVQDIDVRGASTGAQVTYHALPFQEVDPYVTLGGGYRLLWIAPEGPPEPTLLHGLEIVKLAVGLDFRVGDSVALGPMVAGDINVLLWDSTEPIEQPRPSAFLSAGLSGRFDLLGTREDVHGTVVRDDGTPLSVGSR